MYQTATNKDKIFVLVDFHDALFAPIEKSLRNDHLKKDPVFLKKYIPSKNVKPPRQELIEGYVRACQTEEQGEAIAEHILQQWMLKNSDLYSFFEKELSAISKDFTSLTSLEESREKALVSRSEEKFGALATYLFSVINSVCFSSNTFKSLRNKAESEAKAHALKSAKNETESGETKTVTALEDKIRRLQDKYEKKIEGLERKYFNDTTSLKKQLATLQSRIANPAKK